MKDMLPETLLTLARTASRGHFGLQENLRDQGSSFKSVMRANTRRADHVPGAVPALPGSLIKGSHRDLS